MPEPRSLVHNAADPTQVRRAARVEREAEARFLAALKATLDTFEGRLVCWELLSRAGIFRSIWEASARIHYNAGRQDFGHELQALILRASEAGYETMEREARALAKADARANDAAHTPRTQESQS